MIYTQFSSIFRHSQFSLAPGFWRLCHSDPSGVSPKSCGPGSSFDLPSDVCNNISSHWFPLLVQHQHQCPFHPSTLDAKLWGFDFDLFSHQLPSAIFCSHPILISFPPSYAPFGVRWAERKAPHWPSPRCRRWPGPRTRLKRMMNSPGSSPDFDAKNLRNATFNQSNIPMPNIQNPLGKHTKNYGKSACWMGKSTISMAIFNSKLFVYQRVINRRKPDSAVERSKEEHLSGLD
jgi:hypothetical protein